MTRIGSSMAILSLAAGAAVAACGSSGSSATTSTTTAGSVPATGAPVSVTLQHLPHGQATLTYDAAAKTLKVEVKLVGLAPGSSHPNHIHGGSCAQQGGVLYPLTAITADSHGTADVTTTVKDVKEGKIPASGWYVNVHNGPGLQPAEQFQPIVCGDVSNQGGATTLSVPLQTGPPGTPDQEASGSAQLSIDNGSLKVSITAHGLSPKSTHAAHIHAGSCESQGDVVHPLPALTADASGNASETVTIPNVSSIPSGQWYVNVHRTSEITTSTGFDPVICGDVGSPASAS